MWSLSVLEYISPCAYVFLCLFHSGILQVLRAPDLHSSVPSGSPVYPEQPITITCTTRNSQILAWESDEYIGGGGQVVFTSNNLPDSIDTSRNGALAILISVTTNNGEPIIQSELLINITTRSSSSRVMCRNVDNGETDTVVFHKTNESATELLLTNATKICPEDHISVACMARNTSIIEWSSNLSSRQVYCRKGVPTVRNITIGDTELDVFMDLTVTASELLVNQQLSLACLNVDIGVPEAATITFQIADQCAPTVTSVTPSTITQTENEHNTMTNILTVSGSMTQTCGMFIGLLALVVAILAM